MTKVSEQILQILFAHLMDCTDRCANFTDIIRTPVGAIHLGYEGQFWCRVHWAVD